MASNLTTLSASVTRILSLTGFPKELKTKDIQAAFGEWETAAGGFKIKWIDDTSLYIVFQDPTVAKRAYLRTIAFPPAVFSSPTQETVTVIKPYDGPDAQTVIQAINARQQNSTGPANSRRAASISVPGPRGGPAGGAGVFRNGHAPHASMGVHPGTGNGAISGGVGLGAPSFNSPGGYDAPMMPALNGLATSFSTSAMGAIGREPREGSPTLPNIPSHPTLDALIGATLGGASDGGKSGSSAGVGADPAVLVAAAAPRIGDPGKRMVAHSLGMRHPGLGGRGTGEGMTRAMGGLTIAE